MRVSRARRVSSRALESFRRRRRHLEADDVAQGSRLQDEVLGEQARGREINRRLLAEQDELRERNRALLADHDAMLANNQRLLAEQDELRQRNRALLADHDAMLTKNQQLLAEQDNMRRRISEIAAECDVLKLPGTAMVPPQEGAPKQAILLNTLPKSGSIYISRGLMNILGSGFMYIGNEYGLIDQICPRAAQRFAAGGFLSQNHLSPSPENVQMLQHFGLKTVVHIRDPRQSMLSWLHHLDRVTGGDDNSAALLLFAPRTPPGYFKLSMEEKIDWQIDNYMGQQVSWIARWLEIADAGRIPILVTHYESLRIDERSLFDSILDFYGLRVSYTLPKLAKTLAATHYRRADPDEVGTTFTLAQLERATALIPGWMMDRFGWNRSGASTAAQ